MKKNKISEDVALAELKGFLNKYKAKEIRRGQLKDDKIKEEYIDVLEAIQDGYMVFDEKHTPTYTLRHPLTTESGDKDLAVTEIKFKSRVKPTVKADLMDGLKVETQLGKFQIRYIGYIADLSRGEIDKLDPDDYDVIMQIASVF